MTRTRGPMARIALVMILGLAGCAGNAAHDDFEDAGHREGVEHAEGDHGAGEREPHESHEAEREGFVALSPAQRAAAGIRLEAVAPREIAIVRELPGEIVVNADRLAHIVPRFSGIAREVRKNLGDAVGAGEVLAVIEANESLALYEVKSLIAGTVIEKHITLGEFVSDDSDIFVVADLSSVWVNVSVYARDLERIRVGQTAVIEAAGISRKAEGKIDYVGPVVGEPTRTSIARIALANPERKWRPGLFVTARVRTESVTAPTAVADRAIQTVRGAKVVFVEDGEGFRAQEVETGRTDGEWTEILAGLSPGDRVVVENAFVCKSELLKSEAGHGHAH